MADHLFPTGVMDPDANAKLSQRARRLQAPPRAEVRFQQSDEWLCHAFFFRDEGGDALISVCGMKGVVATEARQAPERDEEPERETRRLGSAEGNVFRDLVLRLDPFSMDLGLDMGEEPSAVLEFIEPGRYACLPLARLTPPTPEFELAEAFCRHWRDRGLGLLDALRG